MTVVEDSDSASADALGLLHAAYDALDAVPLGLLDPVELEAFTVSVLQAGERQRALQAKSVTECDRAGVAPRLGSIASTTAFLAARTGGPTKAIAPSRTLGLWLLDFGVFADAWADGVITEDHIRELMSVDNPRTHRLLIRDQELHVDNAVTLDFTQWCHSVAYWLLAADPDGTLPKERDRVYGIRFRTDRNGDIHITGTLDPLAGEALLTMVDHEAGIIHRNELEANVPPIDQTPGRKRDLLALLGLCRRGFQREDGGWPTPLVNIVMSEAVAEDLISRMLDGDTHDPFTLPLDYNDIDQRCETSRGTPLDPRRAWPALITGWLRRQVMSAPDRTTKLGYDVRLFTKAQRQALLVEARGACTTKGCDAPYAWLQADHIQPASKYGPTDLDNGTIKCQPCNHRKHNHTTDHNDRITTDPDTDTNPDHPNDGDDDEDDGEAARREA
ncbi:MAG: HNH endonuclease [Acidimicrobiia bacterium]|nr:HNH endonuclease [Acidimicrobiia bacterium]